MGKMKNILSEYGFGIEIIDEEKFVKFINEINKKEEKNIVGVIKDSVFSGVEIQIVEFETFENKFEVVTDQRISNIVKNAATFRIIETFYEPKKLKPLLIGNKNEWTIDIIKRHIEKDMDRYGLNDGALKMKYLFDEELKKETINKKATEIEKVYKRFMDKVNKSGKFERLKDELMKMSFEEITKEILDSKKCIN